MGTLEVFGINHYQEINIRNAFGILREAELKHVKPEAFVEALDAFEKAGDLRHVSKKTLQILRDNAETICKKEHLKHPEDLRRRGLGPGVDTSIREILKHCPCWIVSNNQELQWRGLTKQVSGQYVIYQRNSKLITRDKDHSLFRSIPFEAQKHFSIISR
ncbi:MAG: hypothetical protein ABIH34_03255, partial [Nanoarchaeota archaeon]